MKERKVKFKAKTTKTDIPGKRGTNPRRLHRRQRNVKHRHRRWKPRPPRYGKPSPVLIVRGAATEFSALRVFEAISTSEECGWMLMGSLASESNPDTTIPPSSMRDPLLPLSLSQSSASIVDFASRLHCTRKAAAQEQSLQDAKASRQEEMQNAYCKLNGKCININFYS